MIIYLYVLYAGFLVVLMLVPMTNFTFNAHTVGGISLWLYKENNKLRD
jgi:hypothetical protein